MQYREPHPHPLLAPYAELIWVLELDRPEEFRVPETILPDGIVEAVFHFGDQIQGRVLQYAPPWECRSPWYIPHLGG